MKLGDCNQIMSGENNNRAQMTKQPRRPGDALGFYGLRHKLATAAVCALLGFIGYSAVFGNNGFLVFRRKAADSERLAREIHVLQEDNIRRQQEIKSLKADPQAIEKEAREHLRYVRPGEVVYTLPSVPPQTTPKK